MVVVLTAHHPVGIVSYGISEQGSQEVFRGQASVRKGNSRQIIKGFSEVFSPRLTLQVLDMMGKHSSKHETDSRSHSKNPVCILGTDGACSSSSLLLYDLHRLHVFLVNTVYTQHRLPVPKQRSQI